MPSPFRPALVAIWFACAIVSGQAEAQEVAAVPAPSATAKDTRTQFPMLLRDSYFGVQVGRIDYPFSSTQLEPGFSTAGVDIPRPTVRVTLFGHQFSRFLSAEATYMRPVAYVRYRNINGDPGTRHVWMHFGGVALRPQLPVTRRLTLYGEAGLGITSRSGFARDGVTVVRDANFGSALLGGGVEYHVSRTWSVTAGLTELKGSPDDRQPRTRFAAAGFHYNLRALPPEIVAANRDAGYTFPAHLLQVEYTTGIGYAINTFLSRKVPVFWGGNVKVDRGIAAHFTRNVFHTRKLFALDVGASGSYWRSRDAHQTFGTLSVYPLLRFMVLRRPAADFFFEYSLAGPSYISRLVIDGRDTGRHFTFQDFMGVGALVGPRRNVALGAKINHYSNGNIFTRNAGVKVPVTLTAGWVF